MKRVDIFKCILVAVLLSLLGAGSAFAGNLTVQSGFPFDVSVNMDVYDKLCYAGHALGAGGGLFYQDGSMVTPQAGFSVAPKYGTDAEIMNNLSAEVDLIYENSDNTGCIREVIRKFDFGDVKMGKEYLILTDTLAKSLKQRKKLYSSDVMSIKLTMTYKPDSGTQRKEVFLLYFAKDDEYAEKSNVIASPPGAQ